MKKKRAIVILTIVLLGLSLVFICFFIVNKKTLLNNEEEIHRLASTYGYKGDVFHFLDYLNGKELEVKNNSIYIDGIDSKVSCSNKKNKKTIITEVGINRNKIELICVNGKKCNLCTVDKKDRKTLKKILNKNKQNKMVLDNNTTTKVVIDTVETYNKKNIKVVARIKNSPGIIGAKFNVDFDNNKLDLIRVENGEAFKNTLTLTKPKVLDAGCSLLWDSVSIKNKDVKDGEMAILYFDVLKEGESSVTLSYKKGDIVNNKLEDVFVSINSGAIISKNK